MMESDHSDLNSKLNSPRVCFRELLGQPDYKEVHVDQPKVRNAWTRFQYLLDKMLLIWYKISTQNGELEDH